jgi:hypothetical protein
MDRSPHSRVGWGKSRTALRNAGLGNAREPAPLYTNVERLTGDRWTEVRALRSISVVPNSSSDADWYKRRRSATHQFRGRGGLQLVA